MLHQIQLLNCDLTASTFKNATLKHSCSFQKVDLTASTFKNATIGCSPSYSHEDLQGHIISAALRFVESKLVKADFSGCKLNGAEISNCDLRHAIFDDCTCTAPVRIIRCDCKAASFKQSKLGGLLHNCSCKAVTFKGAHINDYDPSYCHFKRVYFTECDLSGVDFTCARIKTERPVQEVPLPLSSSVDQESEGINLQSFFQWAATSKGASALRCLDAKKAEYNEGRIILTDSQGNLVQIPPS